MIADFETLCMWMFVVVDEIWQQVAPRFARRRPAPVLNTFCSAQRAGCRFQRSYQGSTVPHGEHSLTPRMFL